MTSLAKSRPVQEARGPGNIEVAVWKREYEGRVFYPRFRTTHVSLSNLEPLQSLCKGEDYATLVLP